MHPGGPEDGFSVGYHNVQLTERETYTGNIGYYLCFDPYGIGYCQIEFNMDINQGRIFQGKEPPQFFAIFQPMVVLKVPLLPSYFMVS